MILFTWVWWVCVCACVCVSKGEAECEDGLAAGFECSNVNLLSVTSLEDLGSITLINGADMWGWTDPDTGGGGGTVAASSALTWTYGGSPTRYAMTCRQSFRRPRA